MIITIGRQYGSGGRKIGLRLAERMNLPFYDKEGLKAAAGALGLDQDLMRRYGEKHASSLLLSLAMSSYSFGYHHAGRESPISQKAYLLAFDIIRQVAKQGPCVIVGRCADYALAGRAPCANVFIHAPLAVREAEVARRLEVDTASAAAKVREIDLLRRNYYNYYTDKEWGAVDSYHFTVDSSLLGAEGTASLLEALIQPMLDGDGLADNVIPLPGCAVSML